MAQQQIKWYTHLVTQEGAYVILSRKGNTESFTKFPPIYDSGTTVDCMVVENTENGNITINFRNDTDSPDGVDVVRKFLGTLDEDFRINMYGVPKWVATPPVAYTKDDIVWDDQKAWKANTLNPVNKPSSFNAEWIEITDVNADTAFDTYDKDLSNTYIYRPVATSSQGNIRVLKTSDHEYEVHWLGLGNASKYVISDHNHLKIDEGEVIGNVVKFTSPKDGVYSVELTVDTDEKHYAEIYDLTDVEKCYLNLMSDCPYFYLKAESLCSESD